MIPFVIDTEVLEILILWLELHKDDIADEINDFGGLKPVYEALFGPAPKGKK